ncbi:MULTISPECIES: Holliday junction branch migration protein RuvA [unclassified Bartonella]|uniref:Holliday junction branch migration protein RuvA n=1 Tax=unclassified Bartonella TaxID=2645622 RepID=UPI0015F889D2|nr:MULTISPECIES: Holliday junction branch migration protein RuvA [unclassified Bartonella]UXN03943.1 Holliday junction branch migration protein RuvA [Bartonella sp. HY406]UXN06925.1 Holliday junction branch migration protein RuvA [Bartonella sp. HY761]
MIGKLKGIIDEIGDDHIILDVHGVGYVVFLSNRTLATLGSIGEAVTLFIETHVREDFIRLYGFTTKLDQEWFKILQNVQGVGAKVALAVIATLSAGELANAIALRDVAMISRAPGVGKKVAERMITELQGKAPAFSTISNENFGMLEDIGSANAPSSVSDAVSALTNLGYSREQAANAVASALKQAGDEAESATLIRLGLKELSR